MLPLKDRAAQAETMGDNELARLARDRDETAVRVLTRRYNRRLFRIARSILRNDAEAEDVVQETWLKAFTGIDQFRGESGFGTWLTRIAMNETLGRLRTRQRRPTVDWDSRGENFSQAEILRFPMSARSNDPERTMAQGEIRLILERATNRAWDVALAPKQTVRVTLTKPGVEDYFCKYHPNMKGRVTTAP